VAFITFTFDFDHGGAFQSVLRKARNSLKSFMKTIDAQQVFKVIENEHRDVFQSEGGGHNRSHWRKLASITYARRMLRQRVSDTPPFDYAPVSMGGAGGGSTGWGAAAASFRSLNAGRKSIGQIGLVLTWSGRLRSSLTGEPTPARVVGDAIRNVTRTGLEFGTRTPYAEIHQTGGTTTIKPIRGTPRRRYSVNEDVAGWSDRKYFHPKPGHPTTGSIQVSAQKYEVNVPRRPPLDDVMSPSTAITKIESLLYAWLDSVFS
jgi:phage gpG-like protein